MIDALRLPLQKSRYGRMNGRVLKPCLLSCERLFGLNRCGPTFCFDKTMHSNRSNARNILSEMQMQVPNLTSNIVPTLPVKILASYVNTFLFRMVMPVN